MKALTDKINIKDDESNVFLFISFVSSSIIFSVSGLSSNSSAAASLPENQSINQSIKHTTNQSNTQPTNQSIDMLKQQIKHTKQSCNPLTERSIIKTINQPINLLREQSIKHLLNRPNDQTNKSNLIRSNTILIIHKQSLQTSSKIKQPT